MMPLRQWRAIVTLDWKLTWQQRAQWFYIFVLPVIAIYLVGTGVRGLAELRIPTLYFDIVDLDGSAAAQRFADDLAAAAPDLILCPGHPACDLPTGGLSVTTARARLRTQTTVGLLIIPSGFGAALAAASDAPPVRFEGQLGFSAPERAFRTVQTTAAALGAAALAQRLSDAALVELTGAAGETATALTAQRWQQAQVALDLHFSQPGALETATEQLLVNGFRHTAPAFIFMFVMITVLRLAEDLAEERSLGVGQRLAIAPARRRTVVAGKLTRTYLLGLTQCLYLLWVGALFQVVSLANLPALLALVVSFVLCMSHLGLLLGSFARTRVQAAGLVTATVLILSPLGGLWWPMAIIPPTMRAVGLWTPTYWAMDAANRLIFYTAGLTDILAPLFLLWAGAFLFGALGVYRYRYLA